MLSSEQMLKINKGWLVTHKNWSDIWVVDERENDCIYIIPVNSDYVGSRLTLYVDDLNLQNFVI